jgi:hypothetical protein
MAYGSGQTVISLIAEATLVAKQYYAVQIGTADNNVVVAGAGATEGAHVLGVVQNKPAAGESAAIAISGVTKLVMAANCDRGEKLRSDGNGKGTPVDADQKSVIGIALESNASGDAAVISVLLTPGGVAQADESN